MAEIESYDVDDAKREALNNASQAVEEHLLKTRAFDQETTQKDNPESSAKRQGTKDRPQPKIFQGTLKQYQLKGNMTNGFHQVNLP